MEDSSRLASSLMTDSNSDMPEYCLNYFTFECLHEFDFYHRWSLNQPLLPVVSVVLYLVAIYYGQRMMKDRKAPNVKWPLFLWNAGLAVFSIMGTIRVGEDAFYQIRKLGFHQSLCETDPDRVRGFWVFAFMMSKFVELGDTAFLVIRKRKLLFLHWYHHVTVLLFTWFAVVSESSTGRYFILMNFFVHSLMYTYFALQTVNIKAPLAISMTITTLQILQMVGGIYVILYTRAQLVAGRPCKQTMDVVNSGLIMYGSYFLLFLNFFLKAYVFSGKSKTITLKDVDKVANKKVAVSDGNSSNGKLAEEVIARIVEVQDANQNHLKSL